MLTIECKTCGNSHPEKYCPACGEKTFDPKQLAIKEFIEELFEGFVHFDNKFIRTLKVLITKPGQLSLEYTYGKRVLHMKPIQLFLVVNLIFFILPFSNLYSLSLYNYVTYTPFINYNTKHIIAQVLVSKHLSMSEYTQLFNEKIKALSKEFIFLFIPFYGLVFYLFFLKKKQYFVEHLVFACHFYAFVLILTLAGFCFITLPFYLIHGEGYSANFDNAYAVITQVAVAVYVAIAINRFYKTRKLYATLVAALVGFTFFMVIQYYRMLLFFWLIWVH